MDWGKQRGRLLPPALLSVQAGEAHGTAQFPGWRRSASGAAASAAGAGAGDLVSSAATGADNTGGRTIGAATVQMPKAGRRRSRQALDDQLVTQILERLVVEPEFLAQAPIADPFLQAQQAGDEGQGLREDQGAPPA